MKHIGISAILILVLAIGYLAFTDKTKDITRSGEIVEISLDQTAFDGPAIIKILEQNGNLTTIAIPSMGIQLCAAHENISQIAHAAIGDKVSVSGYADEQGRIVPCENASHFLNITGFIGDAVFGYEFSYKKGPDGYTAVEASDNHEPGYVTGITLFNEEDYQDFIKSTEAREGPMSISLHIYTNDMKLSSSVWTLKNPNMSHIELAATEPKESVVGGANAMFYTIDGLYPTDVYVVAHGKHMYVLTGSYDSRDSIIYKDFKNIVSSFTFIKSEPQG